MTEEHAIIKLVRRAQGSPDAADQMIQQYMPFIKSETAKFIKRSPMEGQDDELSVAMFAFYEAIMAYQSEKGSFLRFAAVGIRNRLIDHYRRELRHSTTVSLDEPVADGEEDRTLMDQLDAGRDEIAEHTFRSAAKSEIQAFSKELLGYGISLTDVAENSPRQERTMAACYHALDYAKKTPGILDKLVRSRKLPLAQLAKGSGVERKTLERHRKYLVAILLAFTNGFEIIRGQLHEIKQKGGQPA